VTSRTIFALGALSLASLAFLAASPAQGDTSSSSACGVKSYSYAGLQSQSKAHGVSATIDATAAPSVSDGHVGGWIGLGGTDGGPGGTAEWIQVGLSAFDANQTSQLYYEVTVAGESPRYVELAADVKPGDKHHLSVLEMKGRQSWWRVWVDSKPVSPAIHLPGSHVSWYPQAVAENWNGGTGACNGYSYRFTNISLAHADGGKWRPLESSYVFQDAGYKVIPISSTPRSFVATSLAV
jgi:hypothetical protein